MAMPPLSRTPASPTAQQGPNAATSQTVTIRSPSVRLEHPVLRLRGAMRTPGERSERRIQWADDVVDNEGLGRKSSKVCCIYHAPKASLSDSSEDSSSGYSSSDSDADDGSARPAGGKRRADARQHGHNNEHDSSGNCQHGPGRIKKLRRSRSPNAYEKMPKSKGSGQR